MQPVIRFVTITLLLFGVLSACGGGGSAPAAGQPPPPPLMDDGIELISKSADGNIGLLGSHDILSATSDGRFVVFSSEDSGLVPNDTNGLTDVFLVDRVADSIERISVNNQGVEAAPIPPVESARFQYQFPYAISPDGRYVLFSSSATNLIENDDLDNKADLYLFSDCLELGRSFRSLTEPEQVHWTNLLAFWWQF